MLRLVWSVEKDRLVTATLKYPLSVIRTQAAERHDVGNRNRGHSALCVGQYELVTYYYADNVVPERG